MRLSVSKYEKTGKDAANHKTALATGGSRWARTEAARRHLQAERAAVVDSLVAPGKNKTMDKASKTRASGNSSVSGWDKYIFCAVDPGFFKAF